MGLSINRHIFWMILVAFLSASSAGASDTMLMFVGEELDVLSIASRREEAAWSAPAIADVITREDMEVKGERTIAQALEDVSGFYIEKNEKESALFLRGIANSPLFLYDTVPIGSSVQKSNNMIDREISLASVKRIEVIRGTGSVLWGPNAFAGVVNVVPLTGQDFQGVETAGFYSSLGDEIGAVLNYGSNKGSLASFISVSATSLKEEDNRFNVQRFWNGGVTPESPETRYGSGTVDDSYYIEVYGNASIDDWLTVSARLSDSQKAFVVSDWDHQHSWQEKISSPSYIFKLEASKDIDMDSGIRFTGYYSGTHSNHEIVDVQFDQEEQSVFGELIYDRAFFAANGLSTFGISWKKDRFDDIAVFHDFFPDFFVPENREVLPDVEQLDFENELISVFGQYRHTFDQLEIWAGARHDDHERYQAKTSHSLGMAYSYSDFIFKSIYGTAYRTPFAKQLNENGGSKLEEIKSINLQLSWKRDNKKAAITFFRNKIDNHVIEDRYLDAGLSTPNSQTIDGIELEGDFQLTDTVKVSGCLTMLDTNGPNETYLYNDYSIIDEDGNVIKHYQEYGYDYDPGADVMLNVSAAWNMTKNILVVPEIRYVSERNLFYPVQDAAKTYDDVWRVDLNIMVSNLFPFDLGFHFNNILNSRHDTPGLYAIDTHDGFSAAVFVKMDW